MAGEKSVWRERRADGGREELMAGEKS